MTWYLDSETGDVYNPSGEVVGNVDGPPFTIPDDIRQAVLDEVLSNENASVRGVHLKAVLEVSSGDVEFGTPPDTS